MSSARSQTSGQQELTEGLLLSALPEHLFTALFKHTPTVRLPVNKALFLAGDAGDGCYRVDDGLLKVTIASSSGGERILAFVGPGVIVGELSVIDRLPRSASVIAVRNSVLSFLSLARFEDFARTHPEIYKALLAMLVTRLRDTDGTIATGTFLPLRGRVACVLLDLAHDFGKDDGSGRIMIRQRIGQTDLAAMARGSRENVSRILNDWKRHKLVSRQSGYYWIENQTKLQREAEM